MSTLLDKILSKSNLRIAYERVVSNYDSSGVDGMYVKELTGHLHKHWQQLEASIRAGQYRPDLVRGVEIPKPNGGVGLLGILTVLDGKLPFIWTES